MAVPPEPLPNYHLAVWRDPDTSPYVCLLCLPDQQQPMGLPDLTQHLHFTHAAEPLPSPLVQAYQAGRFPAEEGVMAQPPPTYRTETTPDGTQYYVCLVCEQEEQAHWAKDFELFTMHMAQRHAGRMIEAPEGYVIAQQQARQAAAPAPAAPASIPQAAPAAYGEDEAPDHSAP